MEFSFDVDLLFRESVTKIVAGRYEESKQFAAVVDRMGMASAKAQGLRSPITTFQKLQLNRETLYVLKGSTESGKGVVLGIIKVGNRKLFLNDGRGTQHEVQPLCVLDFYVHESRQRTGCGKKLFGAMMEGEGVKPFEVAIDRPSSKFLSFLKKHYNLRSYLHQANHFVVFTEFFQTCKGLQCSSRKPHFTFRSQHSYPPSQTTMLPKQSLPTSSSNPLSNPLSNLPPTNSKPLLTSSNQLPTPCPTSLNLLPTNSKPLSKSSNQPCPTSLNLNSKPLSTSSNQLPTSSNLFPSSKPLPTSNPLLPATTPITNTPLIPPATNEDTPLDNPEGTGKSENNFNWTPGCNNRVPVLDRLAYRNRNVIGTGYDILSGRAGLNRTSNGDSTAVEKAPFLNMRAARVKPNQWRTGFGSTYPFTGSACGQFQGSSALSRGHGTTAALGYSRYGGPGQGPGREGGIGFFNNEIGEKQISGSQAKLKDGWKRFIS